MKTKQFLFLMCSLLLIFGVVGCDKNEAVPDELIGSWKLKGLVETDDNTLRELEPKDCEKCYTLILKADRTYSGFSGGKQMEGKFSLDNKKKTIFFQNRPTIKIADGGEGYLYVTCFFEVHSYSVSQEGLKLFYEDNKYLMYKKIDQ